MHHAKVSLAFSDRELFYLPDQKYYILRVPLSAYILKLCILIVEGLLGPRRPMYSAKSA